MKPNVILINCDDLGYGDLGCYGSTKNQTPHLDRMAEEGVRFTNFYQASSVCTASRTGLLTGCYPDRLSMRPVLMPGAGEGLSPEEKTIGNYLKNAGYATKIIGKWHCGDQPEFLPCRFGFDEYFGIPYSNDMGRQRGKVPGWAGPNGAAPLPLVENDEVIQEQPDQKALTERYTEHAVRFIRNHRNGPFFLYLAHMHVHLPLLVADRFVRESRNGNYGAAVAAIDWSCGVIFDELYRLGLEKNTLVMFTSDNGSRTLEGGSNLPLRGTKNSCWDGGFRVPLIARWPGSIDAGVVSDAFLASLDLLPTLASMTGQKVDPARRIDGMDVSNCLFNPKHAVSSRSSFIFSHRHNVVAVRKDRWKLVQFATGYFEKARGETLELYDLLEDIGETENLADRHPEIVAELMTMADSARNDVGDARLEIEGRGKRPCGRVENAKPLTDYDPNHPYICAEYDSEERG